MTRQARSVGAGGTAATSGIGRDCSRQKELRRTVATGDCSTIPGEYRLFFRHQVRGLMNLHEYQSKEVFREFGIPVPVRHRREERRGSGRRRAEARRQALGGQGPGARGRPRQGRRRQAGARSRHRALRHRRHARPAAGHQTDRSRRPAHRNRVRRVGLGHRARDLSVAHAESRARPHCRHRLGGGRHGHRRSRRAHAGEDPARRHQSRGGAAGLPVPQARLRPGLQGPADRQVPVDPHGAVPHLSRDATLRCSK